MKLSKNGYYKNRHSCFLLRYHLVLVTKYRRPAIQGILEETLKDYSLAYFEKRSCVVHAMETMPDHIHILFDAPPQINLADFVNAYKSASSRIIRKQFQAELSQYYWKPYFWSLSYFISSVSDQSSDVIENYIINQKK